MIQASPPLADLYEIRRSIYWRDFLLSATVGWTSFIIAVTQPISVSGAIATLIAIFTLNRSAVFTHEISHQGRRLPGFEAVWNLLIGFPLLIPTFLYGRVHLDHHQVAKYGTILDPSYLPFARSVRLIAAYLLFSLISPAFLIIRFLVLGPVGFSSKRFERWMLERFSAISINPDYKREVTPHLVRTARSQTLLLYAFWLSIVAIGAAAFQSGALSAYLSDPFSLPLRFLSIWYLASIAISLLEAIRTLSEHSYENAGPPMDKTRQIADSNDIPGGVWTELWSPLALHYHATHHAFPGIPYHQLPRAYERLVAAMPEEFGKTTRRGLMSTLATLFRRARRRQEAPKSAERE